MGYHLVYPPIDSGSGIRCSASTPSFPAGFWCNKHSDVQAGSGFCVKFPEGQETAATISSSCRRVNHSVRCDATPPAPPPSLSSSTGVLQQLQGRQLQPCFSSSSNSYPVSFSSKPVQGFSSPHGLIGRNSSSSFSMLQESALVSTETEVGADDLTAPLALTGSYPEGELGKIFVGNLPYHIKNEAVRSFFTQFGPVRDVICIRSYTDPEKNRGFCFVFFGGSDPNAAAMRAAAFDGVEFHGNPLRVKLDDGRRERERREERERWVKSGGDREFRSEWHQEREEASSHFRRLIEFGPHDTRKVVAAFGKIEKPKRGDYALLVNYYGKKGDKHSARSMFERMRATGIDPNVHVYTK